MRLTKWVKLYQNPNYKTSTPKTIRKTQDKRTEDNERIIRV